MSENRNDAGTEYASVEDPLSMHRTASNETTLSSEIPNVILEENVIIVPGQEKFSASILSEEYFVDRKHFLIFFLGVDLAIILLEMFR